MDKPKEALEHLREMWKIGRAWDDCYKIVLAWADSIPDDAVCVVWPKELTREMLEHLATYAAADSQVVQAFRALAAIAPVRKKRMVNLWAHGSGAPIVVNDGDSPVGQMWRKVGGPFEIEE